MATNIEQESSPNTWSSSADDVIYKFAFKTNKIDTITNDGGFAKVTVMLDFAVTPDIGDLIYIRDTAYQGVYKVLSIGGTLQVTINTPYVAGVTSNVYDCYHLRIPTFELWSGIPSYIDEAIVATITPSYIFEASYPKISINLNDFCRRSFAIDFFSSENEYDTSLFNGFKLKWDGEETTGAGWLQESLVINSTLTNEELQYKYVTGDSGFFLCDTDKPIIYTSGITFLTYIPTGSFPKLYKYINGVKQ